MITLVIILVIVKIIVALTGWTGVVEVEAHVVTIRHAAGADDAGLLNPLLKRWQDQACSQMVFGLPAVQSVINFKWDRCADRLSSQVYKCNISVHCAFRYVQNSYAQYSSSCVMLIVRK